MQKYSIDRYVNQIQKHIKKIIRHDHNEYIPDTQVCSSMPESINVIQHINRGKDKSHMILSIDMEDVLENIHTTL